MLLRRFCSAHIRTKIRLLKPKRYNFIPLNLSGLCLSSGTKKNQYLYILFSIDKRNYNFEWIDFTYTVCNKVLHSLEVVVQSGLNMEKNSHIKGTTKCLQKSKETTLTYWRNIFWAPKIAIFLWQFFVRFGLYY